MMKRKIKLVLTMVSFLLFFVSCSVRGNSDSVTMKVYSSPIPVSSDGKINIAYEIDFSLYMEQGLRLVQVDIIDNAKGKVIESYSKSPLNSRLVLPSSPIPTKEEMWDGTKKQCYPVLYIWLKLEPSDVPGEISHKFIFVNEQSNNVQTVMKGAVTQINNVAPIIISPPMRGQGWLSLETTELFTHHFKNEVTYRNEPLHPERFAIDYMQIDLDNNFFVGDESENKSWICYGKEIIAVADGIITALHKGVADNVPVGSVPEDLAVIDMAGNYVIQDIGRNHFVAYCHMIPESIQVSVGQRVKKGDVLGLIGNSGMSGAPHLHFQITNRNSFIGSDGLPYVLDAFSITGYAILDQDEGDLGDLIISKYPEPIYKENELVENLKVLSF